MHRHEAQRSRASARQRAFARTVCFGAMLLLLNACALLDFGKAHLTGPARHGATSSSPVVRTARSAIGTPYRWGGDSPREGFDCSGLVYWAYGRHGIRLPRPSWKQIHAGFSVPQSQIRAGDLVFFKIVRGQSYHVGIYTGRGTFVHSPKAGSNVRESSLANSYWRRHYVTARRVALPARAQNP
ncbi:MAG: C40 family peptidase [Desulfovibrio sp.]